MSRETPQEATEEGSGWSESLIANGYRAWQYEYGQVPLP